MFYIIVIYAYTVSNKSKGAISMRVCVKHYQKNPVAPLQIQRKRFNLICIGRRIRYDSLCPTEYSGLRFTLLTTILPAPSSLTDKSTSRAGRASNESGIWTVRPNGTVTEVMDARSCVRQWKKMLRSGGEILRLVLGW